MIVPFIEHLFGVQFLSKDLYYISELPSDLRYHEVMCWSSRHVLPDQPARHALPELARVADATGGGTAL